MCIRDRAGGADWQASGNDHSVTLTGTVANEEAKTQAGKDAQAFFGENIAIDNQLVVKAADPVAAIAPVSYTHLDVYKRQNCNRAS